MLLQKEIIKATGVKTTIDIKQEIRTSIEFLKSYLEAHTSIKTLILGISGGQDSTLCGKLSQLAINELRKKTNDPEYQFIAVRMPYGIQIDEKDCQDALNFIQPDRIILVDIKESVCASERALRTAGIQLSDFVRGNEKSRERMKIQYSIAGMTKGLVVGSRQSSEVVTGFFTKYGDGGTDINPIYHLNKRQCKMLLKSLGCPKHLYTKHPTADLEDNRPALRDEEALGITYNLIDNYLEGNQIDESSSKLIEEWYQKTRHKRHLPVTVFDNYWKTKNN